MQGISGKAANFGTPENKKKFNDGTELNTDFDINFYETEFRSYDSQIGRFQQIDPLAFLTSDWSPYSFALNNTILRNDPTGLKDSIRIKTLQEVFVVARVPKLKGGSFNGQSFHSIREINDRGIGSMYSRTKVAFTNEEILARLNESIKSLQHIAKNLQIIGTLGGGSNILSGLQSIKDYAELVKSLKTGKIQPNVLAILTIAATGLYLEGLKAEDGARVLTNLVNNYVEMHSTTNNPNPPPSKGIYVITTMSVSGSTGGGGYYSTTSYYDISTKKILGEITSH